MQLPIIDRFFKDECERAFDARNREIEKERKDAEDELKKVRKISDPLSAEIGKFQEEIARIDGELLKLECREKFPWKDAVLSHGLAFPVAQGNSDHTEKQLREVLKSIAEDRLNLKAAKAVLEERCEKLQAKLSALNIEIAHQGAIIANSKPWDWTLFQLAYAREKFLETNAG